ncbi:curli-like amyloid fiber formation chaperone CsgH [Pararhodobacter oceanensis]|uniref:CsgH-like domain-containing protein n=1 Tax=Pararhodobacter oceanensis TaxID=2172121 RepID=A0A2T8HV72_9RHOB|nr:curli-like amyloid fiber formation chaperone CsgH [Pararhodobacter oceanensis]PVH29321.1 hypothetical protein DDE20_09955 [Pararhodobacter oceanensis]
MRANLPRRTPALIIGLSLAGVAAVACGIPASIAGTNSNTSAQQPTRCEISLERVQGGTMIEGRVTSDTTINGSYTMAITSRSSGGSTTIRQSGDFQATPGTPAILSETRMMGAPGNHDVDLDVRVSGRALSCDQAEL